MKPRIGKRQKEGNLRNTPILAAREHEAFQLERRRLVTSPLVEIYSEIRISFRVKNLKKMQNTKSCEEKKDKP
jgi:hypothetical protein